MKIKQEVIFCKIYVSDYFVTLFACICYINTIILKWGLYIPQYDVNTVTLAIYSNDNKLRINKIKQCDNIYLNMTKYTYFYHCLLIYYLLKVYFEISWSTSLPKKFVSFNSKGEYYKAKYRDKIDVQLLLYPIETLLTLFW